MDTNRGNNRTAAIELQAKSSPMKKDNARQSTNRALLPTEDADVTDDVTCSGNRDITGSANCDVTFLNCDDDVVADNVGRKVVGSNDDVVVAAKDDVIPSCEDVTISGWPERNEASMAVATVRSSSISVPTGCYSASARSDPAAMSRKEHCFSENDISGQHRTALALSITGTSQPPSPLGSPSGTQPVLLQSLRTHLSSSLGALPDPDDKFSQFVNRTQIRVHGCWQRYKSVVKTGFKSIIFLLYLIYLCFAIHHDVYRSLFLVVMTVLYILYFIYGKFIKPRLSCEVPCFTAQWWQRNAKMKTAIKWLSLVVVLVGIIIFLVLDVGADRGRLTSMAGVLVFLFLGFITSTDPARVQWRPVLWGLGLQVTLGVIILRWSKGYQAFKFMGELVRTFLEYTDAGSKFVFGEEGYLMHPVAFKVFPIVIFFSSVIAILYYWGLMQMVVRRIAWLMQLTMGTTAIESLNAATNIFIGMAESVAVVAPYMSKLTKSELHAIMTGGFATVAGSYMAVLIEVGASPEHLLSAAIMSAPAALAMAKLSYPETEHSCTKTEEDVDIPKCQERNLVEAAARGAMESIAVIASIMVNLIAFIALMAFLDGLLGYLGSLIGYPGLCFQLICSFVLWPLSAIMGVEIEDAGKVAKLLGIKIFVDEFISFRDLAILVKEGKIAERSAVIATYACCGFGSVSAVGTYVGALAAVAPDRRGDISEIAFRAAVNGNIAGFLTACIAGVLYNGEMQSMALIPPTNDTLWANQTLV